MDDGNEREISRSASHGTTTLIALALGALAVAIIASGAAIFAFLPRTPNWTDSGVCHDLGTDEVLANAGLPQGIKATRTGASTGGRDFAIEGTQRVEAAISSGTSAQLLFAYRGAVRREIERHGATIHASAASGDEHRKESRDFEYGYHWRNNVGIVKVWSFDKANGQVVVVTMCYEHRN